MSCPAGTTGCNGKVTLLTKTIRIGAFRGALVLGSKSFKIDAGKSATVKVKLIKGANEAGQAQEAVRQRPDRLQRHVGQDRQGDAEVLISAGLTEPFRDLDRRGLAALASGHAVADLCQGAVPALIPFLISERGYSYSAVGALLLFVTVGSSIIQPAFGAVSDRLSMAWLMPVGVLLAALGVGFAGVAPSFELTALAVGVGGLGVAAFHPEGARYANYASGDRRGTGMSFFSVGGNLGFALGPILITPAVLLFGLSGTLIVAIVPAVVAVAAGHRAAEAEGAQRARRRRERRPRQGRRPLRGRLGRVRDADRGRLRALLDLLRPAVLRADLVHPRVRRQRGAGQRGARGDARRGRDRDARRRPAGRPDRPPQGAGRLDRRADPAPAGVHARAQ